APHLPEQAFTVEQALHSYTEAGAYASFEENVKGRIEKGMYADFVLLEDDVFSVEPAHIRTLPCWPPMLAASRYTAARNVLCSILPQEKSPLCRGLFNLLF
ncbi:MAG: amidohydrolase family protein, partial [Oscillospiraceae bacterium]|nr:amidohydrolase family protein [Oscillospiraceae bacterium]